MSRRNKGNHRKNLAGEDGFKCPAEPMEQREQNMSYMNYAESLWRRERSVDLLLLSTQRKKQILVLFLAQEKNEKNIHPPQGPSLYGGDAT